MADKEIKLEFRKKASQEPDNTVILRFMDSEDEFPFKFTWSIELPTGISGVEIVKIKMWVDEHIDLGSTARAWLKRANPEEHPPEYLLSISGSGNDNRWGWFNAFVSALNTHLERKGYKFKKIGRHDFEL